MEVSLAKGGSHSEVRVRTSTAADDSGQREHDESKEPGAQGELHHEAVEKDAEVEPDGHGEEDLDEEQGQRDDEVELRQRGSARG